MTPVESSAIRAVGYDVDHGWLDIVYVDGVHCRYLGVPAGVYEALMDADSKGGYVNQYVRGRYLYTFVRHEDAKRYN